MPAPHPPPCPTSQGRRTQAKRQAKSQLGSAGALKTNLILWLQRSTHPHILHPHPVPHSHITEITRHITWQQLQFGDTDKTLNHSEARQGTVTTRLEIFEADMIDMPEVFMDKVDTMLKQMIKANKDGHWTAESSGRHYLQSQHLEGREGL